jgi:hypothetical protein
MTKKGPGLTEIIASARLTRRALVALAATAPICAWAQGEPGAVALTLRQAIERVWLAYQCQKYIALDVIDIEAVLSGRSVLACCASGYGPERANMAAQRALSHFAESARVADGALVLVSAAAPHFKLWESRAAMNRVRAALPRRASVIYATLPAHRRDGRLEVTLLLACQSQRICSIATVAPARERSAAPLRKQLEEQARLQLPPDGRRTNPSVPKGHPVLCFGNHREAAPSRCTTRKTHER